MIKYRVTSGDMDETVSTLHQASADAICFLALHQMLKDPVESLGALIEISGGQFVGDDVTYTMTDRVMRDAGLMAQEATND